MSRRCQTLVATVALCLTGGTAVVAPGAASAGIYYVQSCADYGDAGGAYSPKSTDVALTGANECSVSDRSLELNTIGPPPKAAVAGWSAVTPSSAIEIIAAYTPPNQIYVDCSLGKDGYNSQFYWGTTGGAGSSQLITPQGSDPGTSMCYGPQISRATVPSRYFGWQVTCARSGGCGDVGPLLGVRGVQLEAEEDSAPEIIAEGSGNLWYQAGRWVRGSFPIDFAAYDGSGVCAEFALVDDHIIDGPSAAPDMGSFTQCPDPLEMATTVDTSSYPNGTLTLQLAAKNAAGVVGAPVQTLKVDNSPVAVSLTGPTDASSTSGTQHIVAIATAGPSGVAGILCTVDGSPWHWHAGATADLAVSGIGTHKVSCYAANNAVDSSGTPALSTTKTWTMTIRQPTIVSESFSNAADKLDCRRQSKIVTIPAHWTTVDDHGKSVRVRVPAVHKRESVQHCHPQVAHAQPQGTERISYGARTTMSGWLGTSQGTALAGQVVRIMSAADNGGDQFSQIASVVTAANGSWSAQLPPGPSRLIEAVFAGSSTAEPSSSAPVHVIVPASLTLSVRPHSTHWGQTVSLSGFLNGGYIPAAGELVVLRIGWHGGSAEIGHLYAGTDGHFTSTYTFLRGTGHETYHLWAHTAIESDYPYAAASSRKVVVRVGP